MKLARLIYSALLVLGVPAVAESDQQAIVGIISGSPGGTYARFAQELEKELSSEQIRILPILGRGSQQNIEDLLSLSAVDMAIVQNDVLFYYAKTDLADELQAAVRYVMKLYNEEVHVLVRRDTPNLQSLNGAAVSVGRQGSGTEMTSRLLFDAYGVEIQEFNLGPNESIAFLQAGDIDAAVFVVGKPYSLLKDVSSLDGLKLLPLEHPGALEFPYFETELSSVDYPELIRGEASVPTLAVGAILAVFNRQEGSTNYQALSEVVIQLFDTVPLFQQFSLDGSVHPKWAEVDPIVNVPGWTRFEPANEWLRQNSVGSNQK